MNKCFNSFNYKRLVSLIKKKYVNVQIFSDLLYKSFKCKIIRLSSSFVDEIGILQKSVLGFVLINIYLHEMDYFILEGEEFKKFRNYKDYIINPIYSKFLKISEEEENCKIKLVRYADNFLLFV